MKTIQSPDGLTLLMENLWLRHKAGMKQRPSNIYMVELPPPTEEELTEARRDANEDNRLTSLDVSGCPHLEELDELWLRHGVFF